MKSQITDNQIFIKCLIKHCLQRKMTLILMLELAFDQMIGNIFWSYLTSVPYEIENEMNTAFLKMLFQNN